MNNSSPSTYQLNENEADYLSFLLSIIESQNWEAFGYAICSNPTDFQWFARKISRLSELNGMTILHACARFNPPALIVKILLELVPESPSLVDCLNRTPLHVAAGTRANLATIQLLADACPVACSVRDEDGKTPLHLACDSACELFEGDKDCERFPPSYDVVSTIVKTWPSAVIWEDNDGTSALEHAILSGAPIKIIRLLQATTCWQTMKQAQEISTVMSNSESRDCLDSHQQQHPTIASIPVPDDEVDSATSEGHFPSRRRGGIFL